MEFLKSLRIGDSLTINQEKYIVCRKWNGRTVQVQNPRRKLSQSIKTASSDDFIEFYDRKYGYSAKPIQQLALEKTTLETDDDTTLESGASVPSFEQVPVFPVASYPPCAGV